MEEAEKGDKTFARIASSMYKSPAWKKLTIQSRYLYMEFKMKYNGKNYRDISFTVKEGRAIMNVNTFVKCINQLVELGFIDRVYHSPNTREPTIYGLSDRWKQVKKL